MLTLKNKVVFPLPGGPSRRIVLSFLLNSTAEGGAGERASGDGAAQRTADGEDDDDECECEGEEEHGGLHGEGQWQRAQRAVELRGQLHAGRRRHVAQVNALTAL